MKVEREIEAVPADFRLWVCLHESTHRLQFSAVDWMTDYFRQLIADYAAVAPTDSGEFLRHVVRVVTGRDAVLMTYNRNNVQHLFALPSLISSLFRTRRALSDDAVITACRAVYPFLRSELFLPWAPADSETVVHACVERMLERGLLERDAVGHLCRPEVTVPAFGALTALAGIVAETLERHAMAALVLAREQHAGIAPERQRFEDDCRKLAERLAILTGREAPEFFDKQLFRTYLDTLIDVGLAHENESGEIEVDGKIGRIAARSMDLLSDETRQTLLHLLVRQVPAAPTAEHTSI